MVVALFVVAFAMVVAGMAAIYDGYAIIVMEKGWTKVISGTVAASAGLILFGITAAIAQLKRIGRDLAHVHESAGRLDAPFPAPPQPLVGRTAPEVDEALTAGALRPAASEPDASGILSPGGAAEPSRQDKAAAVASETPRPDTHAPRLPASSEPASKQRVERAVGPSGEEHQAGPEKPVDAPSPTVVGTYSSGGNTYVMYSDGSIQAETPTGRFRFDSLDELKAFIAAGGESVPPAR